MKNTALSKLMCKRNAINKQNLNIFHLKILFSGLQESRDPGAWTTTRESSSSFIFVMTKNWQRIFKTPDKIIDLFFFMLLKMRESRHISSSGTVLICWQHSWTSFLFILREEWMAGKSLSNHHCCELQRNWHQKATFPSHWGKEQRFYWTGCSVKYSWI